jgi:hypothetical protein
MDLAEEMEHVVEVESPQVDAADGSGCDWVVCNDSPGVIARCAPVA